VCLFRRLKMDMVVSMVAETKMIVVTLVVVMAAV
jgi:hypothetical protein